ncbi:MAG: hypothetical protein KF866_11230 [Phycisphaeraceae bacterium]|nr:hypothetical protein [Phycisphaeraceae bacterium]
MSRCRAIYFAVVLVGGLAGCSSSPSGPVDGWMVAANRGQPPRVRAAGVERGWASESDVKVATAKASELFWTPGMPAEVRIAAVRSMASEPAADAALKRLVRLSLPHESNHEVMVELCSLTLARRWIEMTPGLVRGLSLSVPDVDDGNRVEAKTLTQLHPGRSLTEIALGVLTDPGAREPDEPPGLDLRRRARIDAWNLLARTDPGGEARRAWADQEINKEVFGGAVRAFVHDTGVLPRTGEELVWAEGVWREQAGRAWLGEVREAVALLSPMHRAGLEMRHLEPVRLARGGPWFDAPRSALYAEVERRQAGRTIHVRSIDQIHRRGPNRERVRDWVNELGWGDLLSILVVDDAMRQGAAVREFLKFADLDRRDVSTEYGGALFADPQGAPTIRLYPPRPGERAGDERFIASREMLDETGTALAYFHFHVQPRRFRDVAGPSRGDLLTAALLGRTSLVLTMVRPGVLNVDVYFPTGAVIDLGEIGPGEAGS